MMIFAKKIINMMNLVFRAINMNMVEQHATNARATAWVAMN